MTDEVSGTPSHSAGSTVPDLNPNTQAPVSPVTPEGPGLLATRNNGPWEKHTQSQKGSLFSMPLGRMESSLPLQAEAGREFTPSKTLRPLHATSHPGPEPQELSYLVPFTAVYSTKASLH